MQLFLILIIIYTIATYSYSTQTYTVEEGDTLWDIAKKFNVSVTEIARINNLRTPNRIRIGKKLIIPSTTTREVVNTNLQHPTTIIVKEGDTLWDIAKKFNVSVTEIARINNLRTPDRIRIGKKLIIPSTTTREVVNTNPQQSTSITGSFVVHKVKEGECLEGIARKYNTTVAKIKSINNLTTDMIHANELLIVPVADKLTPQIRENITIALSRRNQIIKIASRYLGYRYTWGRLDCSGFVRKVFEEAVGVKLPHSAAAQFKIGKPVKKKDLMPGDRVFFTTYKKGPSHVGIYIGNNKFIHASSRKKRVTIDDLNEPYYRKRYIGATR